MSEKRKNKKSKEEIAREFDLPERKSKIATIMKQDGQAYCICRSSDCSRFMIGCDACEEWYHGDCINITEKDAKHIKHYFCQKCRQNDPNLQTVFRVIALERRTSTVASAHTEENNTKRKTTKAKEIIKDVAPPTAGNKQVKRCGTCEGCRRPNCNVCDACRIRVGHKPRCIHRTCMMQQPRQPYRTAAAKKKEKPVKERARKRNRSASPEIFINPELQGNRHCNGPGCCNQARPQSKYCSDDCGLKLATNRIFHLLPLRLQEWNLTSCRSAEENKKQLESVRTKQAAVRRILSDLDVKHHEIDTIVERAKRSTIDPQRVQDNSDVEDEQSMYCITCGHEIHSRTAIKHMEKCFNKYESQASFGSIFKTRIEGNSMFCDYYNTVSKTYCKRLRVLCPEHSKDPKVSDSDVCGAPVVNDNFQLTGTYCRAPKKNCFKHYAWEKMRRAEIDLERVRQWLKLDELIEQERQIRQQMSSRAGLLNLLLHTTYNHEIMDEYVRKQQEHMAEVEKQMQYMDKKRRLELQQQQLEMQYLQQQQQLQYLQQQKQQQQLQYIQCQQ